jgi:hypothetical protein
VAAGRGDDSRECDLMALAKDVVMGHPDLVPLGCRRGRLWPFVPVAWPYPFPPLSCGGDCDPTWWLMFCFEVWDETQLGLSLHLTPLADQALRMRVVDRLLRDEQEFGLRRESLVNLPGVPKQWVFFSVDRVAPLQGHGLSVAEAKRRMVDAIDKYVARFQGIGAAVWPLLEGR